MRTAAAASNPSWPTEAVLEVGSELEMSLAKLSSIEKPAGQSRFLRLVPPAPGARRLPPVKQAVITAKPPAKRGENRLVLLGLILAALPDVPFEDVAKLLRTTPGQLEGFIHGPNSIPRRYEHDWKSLIEVLGILQTVIQPSATGRWLNTPIPALSGKTPLETVQGGKMPDVVAVVRSYCEPSFT